MDDPTPKKKYKYKKKADNITNATGKPPYFNSPEEMQAKIDDYITNCPDERTVYFKLKDEVIEKVVPCPTITGLVLFLGFADRQSFFDYAKKDEYSYILKRARTFIEKEYEHLLRENGIGAIFALKNLGWMDERHLTQDITENLHVEYESLSDDDLDKELKNILKYTNTGGNNGCDS